MKINNYFVGQKVYCAGLGEGYVLNVNDETHKNYPVKVCFPCEKPNELCFSKTFYFNEEGVRLGDFEPTLSTIPYKLKGFSLSTQEPSSYKHLVGIFGKFYKNNEFVKISKLKSVIKHNGKLCFISETNNDYYDSFEPLTIEDVEKLKLLKD
jgi:hypothetical protein